MRTATRAATDGPTTDETGGIIRPAKVKVKISRDRHGSYKIKSNYPLPSSMLVRTFLTGPDKELASSAYYLGVDLNHWVSSSIANGARAKNMANAITAATAHILHQAAETEVEREVVGDSAYLALGNTVFHLSPVEYIAGGARALTALRHSVIEQAKAKSARIIEAAEADGRNIQDRAREVANRITVEVQQIQERHRAMATEIAAMPPAWVRNHGIPFRMYDGVPQVGIFIKFKIDYFYAAKRARSAEGVVDITTPYTMLPQMRFRAKPDLQPVPVLLWSNLNCEGLIVRRITTSLSVDLNYRGALPHIGTNGCMEIGDAPASLTSYPIYHRYRDSIERTMRYVNFDSLLVTYSGWMPDVQAFLPDNLKPLSHLLVMGGNGAYQINLAVLDRGLIPDEVIEPTPAADFTTEPLPEGARLADNI